MAAMTADRLVAQATRASLVVWVGGPGTPPRAVWHVWHEGAAYVLTGPGEQDAPGLADGGTARVAVRSRDRQGDRVVDWAAEVSVVPPGSAGWEEMLPLLRARRLNDAQAAGQPERWARACTLWRLAPTGQLLAPDYSPLPSSST